MSDLFSYFESHVRGLLLTIICWRESEKLDLQLLVNTSALAV